MNLCGSWRVSWKAGTCAGRRWPVPPRSTHFPWGIGYRLGRERGQPSRGAGSWPFSMSLAASWTRHTGVTCGGDLRSSGSGGDLGCRCRPEVWPRMSNAPARLRAWGTDDTPVLRAGRRSSGEGKRVWETLRGARGWGFLLTPERSIPAARGLESLACHTAMGVPRRIGGELVYLRPLDFPPLDKNYSRIVRSKPDL